MNDSSFDTFRLVSDPAALVAAGLFVVEGREAIARLLRTEYEVVSLLLTSAARLALQPAIDDRHGAGRAPRDSASPSRHSRMSAFPDVDEPPPSPLIVEVSSAQMREVTGFNFHRGALAMARRPPMRSVDDLLRQPVAGSLPPDPESSHDGRRPHAEGRSVYVVLEHLVDVDNVGSCFRNARAFGAAAVLLDERCADPLYRKAVRTSMGTVLEMPWTIALVADVVDALHTRGISTLALTPAADACDLASAVRRLDAAAPIALVVGNEGHGLSAETLARCTQRARIPMAAGADSLNVATALAVGLYATR